MSETSADARISPRRLFRWLGLATSPRARARDSGAALDPANVERALDGACSQDGESLLSLSRSRPRLVVCLRHLGCTFCREALADLARNRDAIEGSGAGIVLVHMARDGKRAERLFGVYKLADLPRVADPERLLYRALGLEHGGIGELVGPRVLMRTIEATCRGHLPGRMGSDTRQMPGAFLIDSGRILAEFRHRTAADRPDYLALVRRSPARQGA